MTVALITLGDTGLVKGDIDLRIYRDGVSWPSALTAIALNELTNGDYRLSNLPSTPKGSYTALTWRYPPGVGSSLVYPTQDGAPPNYVIPAVETGLAINDFEFSLYKDAVAQGDTLSIVEFGTTGDYLVSGWSSSYGQWSLVWRRHGLSFKVEWAVLGGGTQHLLELLATQYPFYIGVDERSRHMISCNYSIVGSGPDIDWPQQIVKLLNDNSLGTGGVDTFIGNVVPIGSGPLTLLIPTGGRFSVFTHDDNELERPSVQIIVRADLYETASTRAVAIWRLLNGLRNFNLAA